MADGERNQNNQENTATEASAQQNQNVFYPWMNPYGFGGVSGAPSQSEGGNMNMNSGNPATVWPYHWQYYYYWYYSMMCYNYYLYTWQNLTSNTTQQNAQAPQQGQAYGVNFQGAQPPYEAQDRADFSFLAQQHLFQTGTQGAPVQYRIAPLVRRGFAEIIDFVFLYFIKFVIFSAVYSDIDYYSQIQYTLIIDDATSLKDLESILVQAFVYRILVFLYELYFLSNGVGVMGCATPGKYMMGLRVVSCDYSENILGQNPLVITVTPGHSLGLWRSCVRAMVKNFSITFFFPLCFTVVFFQHYRTVYDIIAGSIVVVAEPERQQREPHPVQ